MERFSYFREHSDKIYSDNFKKWFGDWENGNDHSCVVDENGYPMVVFHGTMSDDFDEFVTDKLNWVSTSLDYSSVYGDVYSLYANVRNPLDIRDIEVGDDWEEVRPILAERLGLTEEELDDPSWCNESSDREIAWSHTNSEGMARYLKEHGYDALLTSEGGADAYGVLYSRQLKSIDNNGRFGVDEDNIYEGQD